MTQIDDYEWLFRRAPAMESIGRKEKVEHHDLRALSVRRPHVSQERAISKRERRGEDQNRHGMAQPLQRSADTNDEGWNQCVRRTDSARRS